MSKSARLASSGLSPKGSKTGDPIAIGAIAIAVLPSVLPKIVEAVQAWIARMDNPKVKFKGRVAGQQVEFEGSAEELHKLLAKLEKGKKKKR